MSEWDDEGILLDKIKISEVDGIISFFSKNHGYIKSFCKNCFTPQKIVEFQKGNLLLIKYNAKTDDALGIVYCNLTQNYSSKLLKDLLRLNILNSVCSLITMLPERENNIFFYLKTKNLFNELEQPDFLKKYSLWELDFLSTLGFGLDFSKCILTGSNEDLAFVSPKSGCAVSRNAAEPWKDKLIELPSFLIKREESPSFFEIKKALYLTGFFLENHVVKTLNCTIPNARKMLIDSIQKVSYV